MKTILKSLAAVVCLGAIGFMICSEWPERRPWAGEGWIPFPSANTGIGVEYTKLTHRPSLVAKCGMGFLLEN